MVSVVGMLLGLSFNGGIQYDRQVNTESRVTKLETEYSAQHDAQMEMKGQTDTRLGNIETLLHVMKDQLDKMQHVQSERQQ